MHTAPESRSRAPQIGTAGGVLGRGALSALTRTSAGSDPFAAGETRLARHPETHMRQLIPPPGHRSSGRCNRAGRSPIRTGPPGVPRTARRSAPGPALEACAPPGRAWSRRAGLAPARGPQGGGERGRRGSRRYLLYEHEQRRVVPPGVDLTAPGGLATATEEQQGVDLSAP